MMKKLLSIFIITTLLIGCDPVIPIASVPTSTMTSVIPTATVTLIPKPVVKFLPPNFLGKVDEYGVDLDIGIYAVNKDMIFLLGEIRNRQSILLRSTDGGKHWVEAMSPAMGSSVIDFQMLETGEGWSLVMWVVEGPGKLLLFHTTNNGLTWEYLSEIPKPIWFSVPANMVFFDSMNGQMVMSTIGSLNDDGMTFITSNIRWRFNMERNGQLHSTF
ncbi:MAG: hypothetical protein M3R47_14355 [Chloroflexota bacterium]|nr:hypothetical protein [Chloroflexota bacterium]